MTEAEIPLPQLRDAARLLYVSRRNQIEHAEKATTWAEKRTPEWFDQQRLRLVEIEAIGKELRFLADHAADYAEWKASILAHRGAA